MAELPSDTMYNIFSRMRVKSLARFRSVCKLWCNYIDDPHLATIHVKEDIMALRFRLKADFPKQPCKINSLNIIESKRVAAPQEKIYMVLELCKDTSSRYPFVSFSLILGSCNGLILLYAIEDRDDTTFVVIHPLRKECYELPPIKLKNFSIIKESYGLGFDDSTNTFKMVFIYTRKHIFRTMVHVLGTKSWREVHQVPPYPTSYGKGVFLHGSLHWIFKKNETTGVIYFDVRKEEFGILIDELPKQIKQSYSSNMLVDLHGEVGIVYNNVNRGHSIEVWVLKQREWVMHCQFDVIRPRAIGSFIDVLGCWNKEGDLLITSYNRLFVYNLKSGTISKANISGRRNRYVIYRSNMFSIQGINRHKS